MVLLCHEKNENEHVEIEFKPVALTPRHARVPPEPGRQKHAIRNPHPNILCDVPEIISIEPTRGLHYAVVEKEDWYEGQKELLGPGFVGIFRKPVRRLR